METSRNRERRDALLRLAVAGLGMMQVMMYAFPAYIAGDAGISADAAALMRWASLMLTFPVVVYSSWPFFRGAARDLQRGRAGMDVPVAIGIGTAFAASVVATIAGHGEVYFDSVAMARLGIVVTRGQAMETLARATHFVFDKTGTLTEGHLRVVTVRLLGDADHDRAVALAAALEQQSEHPLGKAIVAAAARGLPAALEVKNFPGKGIEGRRVRIGRKSFVAEICRTTGATGTSPAQDTTVWLGDERGALAQFLLEDRVRDDARELVSDLRGAGRFVMLLSGDGTLAVRAAATSAGIPYYRARMLPEQKLSAVRELQDKDAVVAMIGDGVNDAPVLAQAQVSISMGTGAALAQGAADMVLVSPRLSDLGRGLRLSRKTLRIVRQNLSWAFAYNMVALPLAVSGWLTPWISSTSSSRYLSYSRS